MIKKMLVITVILSIAFTISACSKTKKETEPINIHILLPFPDADIPYFKTNRQLFIDTAENFHKLNPQITVTIDQIPGNMASGQDFLERIKSNEPSDIVPNIIDLKIAEKEKLLLDLLPLQQSSGSKEIDVNKGILDSAMINGELFFLPYSADPYVVLYNKDFFDSANIPYPQGEWTWEQFRDISKKLKPTGGSILPYDPVFFDSLLQNSGISMLSPNEETYVGYLDSPEAIRTLQWLNAYYHDDETKISPNFVGAYYEFEHFQTGMALGQFFAYSFYKKSFGDKSDKLGVAPLPHFESGKRANQIYVQGFGISRKSKHPEAAWKFIEYLTLTNNETTNKFADYYLTTSKSISEATGQSSDPIKSIFEDEMNYVAKPASYKAWNEDLTAEFQKLLTADDKDIPVKLHDLAMKLDQELNRLKLVNDQQAESPSP